jgi:DNA-binding LacI/PurR family transcriptional regulator
VTAGRWSGAGEACMAVQFLLNRLGGNRKGSVQRVMLSTEFITRASCAPPPSGH